MSIYIHVLAQGSPDIALVMAIYIHVLAQGSLDIELVITNDQNFVWVMPKSNKISDKNIKARTSLIIIYKHLSAQTRNLPV